MQEQQLTEAGAVPACAKVHRLASACQYRLVIANRSELRIAFDSDHLLFPGIEKRSLVVIGCATAST
jgi:hypothetical protein